MVGRDEEFRALVRFGRSLPTGGPGVLLVSGRAGTGKTRLVTEVAQHWSAQGTRVLVGGCAPVEGPPYTPLVTALRGVVPPTAPVLQILATGQANSRAELFEALGNSLAALSQSRPVVLVVEDLHWSDKATRDALAYLATQTDEGRWGLVGTHRYEGALSQFELASFVDALERRPITRISLEPLTSEQAAAQIAAITGKPPSEEYAANVFRRSGGIPLLVEEVVAAGESGVPAHLRSLFLARVAEHGADVLEALRVIAVADTCDELVVAEVLGVDVQRVAAALREARDADLVAVDPAGYRFRHDLLREAAYDDVAPGRRRELHRLVGQILSCRADADRAVIAAHWHEAGERELGAIASVDAARQADRLLAPAAAHQHYERVLQAWPALSEAGRRYCGAYDELLRRAALAAERSGAFLRAAALTEERIALAEGGPADQALRCERLARYRWEGGDGPGSRAAYEEAVRVLPADAPAEVRAKVLSGLAWHLAATFRYDEATRPADEAMAACADVDDAAVRWQVYLAWGIARLGTEEGHRALEESCRLATALGTGDQVALTRMWLNLSIQRVGLTAEREPNLRTALRAAKAHGLGRSMEAALRYMLAEMLLENGRWDEADEEIEENVRLQISGIPALFTWGYRSRLAAWRGDAARLATSLERTRSLAELAPQQPLPLAVALTGQAELLLWQGKVDEGAGAAREALRLASVDPYNRFEPLAVVCRAAADRAEQLRRRGDNLDDEALVELAARVEEAAGAELPRIAALTATSRAELSRMSGERVAEPWRAAVAAWVRAGDAYQEACARLRLAWALVANRSGRAEAATHLARARDVADRLAARPLHLAVEGLATRARLPLSPIRPTEAEPSLAAALTPRELEVLPLLAAGRTNAEIADILVISPRTVGVHVSAILHRLGADRRAQVAELARRAGLLDS